MHSRKSFLFWKDSTCVKKEADENFEILMGCCDGAEICELVGIYIQDKLCKLMNKKDFGLYRDDGLGIFRKISGHEENERRKNIIKIFKECGLSITCEVNKKITDILDLRLNLNHQTYGPYRKSINEPVYINKQTTTEHNSRYL